MQYAPLRFAFALDRRAPGGRLVLEHSAAASGPAARSNVTERDFHITAPKEVSSGNLLLKVSNKGPDQARLIVVRAPSTRLPIRSDGLTVNEEILQPVTEPSLEPGKPGNVR